MAATVLFQLFIGTVVVLAGTAVYRKQRRAETRVCAAIRGALVHMEPLAGPDGFESMDSTAAAQQAAHV